MLADQAWHCLHLFTAHPAPWKWFCILTKCTVTFLYLLRAPPPPTRRGKSTLLLAEEAAKRLPWQPFSFQQLLFWFEGEEGEEKEKKKKNHHTPNKLRRTRQFSDQSSDKEGHSNLWALTKLTPGMGELPHEKQTEKVSALQRQ